MTNTYVDGRLHVRRTNCDTCIFRANKFVTDERVAGMVEAADADNSTIPCHKHLYEGAEIEPVCRGYFDRASSMAMRLAVAMDIVTFGDPERETQT